MTAPEPQARPDVDLCPRCADAGRTVPVHAHDRDGAQFAFRCPIDGHRWQLARWPEELKPMRSHTALHRGRTALKQAAMALGVWHHGPSREGSQPGSYIKAGHDAVARIDEALRALYDARGALIGELGRNEELSAQRTDALLAARRGPENETAPGRPGPGTAHHQAHDHQ